MNGCRISRVRHKATGQTIEVITPRRREGHAATLVEHAATIADSFSGDLAGFLIVGVDHRGLYSVGSRLSEDAPLGPTLFTALLTEIVRREFVTSEEVASFCVRQGWLSE